MMFKLLKNSELEKLPRYEQYATVAGDTYGHLVIVPRPQCKAVCDQVSKDYAHFRLAPFSDAVNKSQYIAFDQITLSAADVPALTGTGERVPLISILGLNSTATNRTIIQEIEDFASPVSLVYKVPSYELVPEKPSQLADQLVAAKGIIQDVLLTVADEANIGAVTQEMIGVKQWQVIADLVQQNSTKVKAFFEAAYKWDPVALSSYSAAVAAKRK